MGKLLWKLVFHFEPKS